MRRWWWASGVYQLLRVTVVSQDKHLQPPPHSICCGVRESHVTFLTEMTNSSRHCSHSLSLSLLPSSTFFLFTFSHGISCLYWKIQEAVEDNFTYQREAKLIQSLIYTTMSSLPYKVYVLGLFLQKAVHSLHIGCVLQACGTRAVGSWWDDQLSDPWMKGSSLWRGFKLTDPKTTARTSDSQEGLTGHILLSQQWCKTAGEDQILSSRWKPMNRVQGGSRCEPPI